MSNELTTTTRPQITSPQIWEMVEKIAEASSVSKYEQIKFARKLHYCLDNGLPLSLATTGGVYFANSAGDIVSIETQPLLHHIANHPEYSAKITHFIYKSTND